MRINILMLYFALKYFLRTFFEFLILFTLKFFCVAKCQTAKKSKKLVWKSLSSLVIQFP